MNYEKRKIVIFDFNVTKNSPGGSCVLQMVTGLYKDYDITVISEAFENPAPDKIGWIHVPLPGNPVFLRYIAFYLLAPIYYKRYYLATQEKPWLVISTQGEFINCDISYAHFGHRAYLNNQWRFSAVKGLRRAVRWINHQFNAWTESQAFANANTIVVPSKGLASELSQTYPEIKDKIVTLPNPVDVNKFALPEGFDNRVIREQLGLSTDDLVMVFVALGDFERKGLNLLLEALTKLQNPNAKVLVVGGTESVIEEYKQLQNQLGLSNRVVFAGFQGDVRPYLWSSDVFVLASSYEVFPLVALQAPAAGLPVVATKVYGVEEFLQDGVNGWLVERDVTALTEVLEQALSDKNKLAEMGVVAQNLVSSYDATSFVNRWRLLLESLAPTKTEASSKLLLP
jgi:glycosyltransferase involved in cell wall biosynthesis